MSSETLWSGLLSFNRLGKIYFQSFCRSLGRSLIRLFIPAYLLHNGFSLGQIVFQYYIISYLVWTLSAFGVIKIVESFTARTGFLYAALLGIIDSWMLFNMKEIGIPLIAVAITHGASEAFFWSSYHYSFIVLSTSESRGRAISLIRILAKAGKVVGPAIGGWLLHDHHTSMLLFISSTLLVLSVLPMWLEKPSDHQQEMQAQKAPTRMQNSSDPESLNHANGSSSEGKPALAFANSWDRDLVTWICLIASGVEKSVGNSIWPLFCALTFFGERVHLFGYFSSTVLGLSLILTYAMGNGFFPHWGQNRSAPLLLGGGLSAVMWILRLFVEHPWQVAVVDTCYNWSNALLHISFFASVYDLADHTDRLAFTLRQEMAMGLGEILAWSCVYLLIPATAPQIQVGADGMPPMAPFSRWLFLLGIAASGMQSALIAASRRPQHAATLSI